MLQGTVEATGTFSDLQESGLDFARQLGLDVEEEDKDLKEGPWQSYDKLKRQDSGTSERVSTVEHHFYVPVIYVFLSFATFF
jgi:hypothetical protein